MAAACAGCHQPLEPDWIACPHCGRPVSGQASTDGIAAVIAKVCGGLVEAGLLQAVKNARRDGRTDQVERLEAARGLAKEVTPMLADAVTTYTFQKRTLGAAAPPAKATGPS